MGPGAEAVVRTSPGAALEAARRRACLPAYQSALLDGLEASSKPDADRNASLDPLLRSIPSLTACWTADAPAPTATASLGPDSAKPGRCSSIGADGTSVARGFGSSVESAAEDAIRRSVISRTSNAIATVASLRYAELQKGKADGPIRDAMGGLTALSGATDAIDRSRLACSTAVPSPATWRPTDDVRAADCNAASWTEMPKDPITATVAASFTTGVCELQVAPTVEIFQFAIAKASGRKQTELAQNAYKVTGACEVDCIAHVSWGGEPVPFRLAGTPDRSSKDSVLSALTPVTSGSKPVEGLSLLPTLQTPAQLESLLSGELGARLAAELRDLGGRAERWKTVEGQWILLP